MTFDELRAAHPQLGFSLFAMTPGEDVTLEVYFEDNVHSFTGPTAQAALDTAFPPAPPAPEPNVFD